MIEALKPYAEYNESGVSWLGKIPTSWDIRRGKYLFRFKKELNSNALHKNVLSLTMRGVVNNNPDNPVGMVPKDYASYQMFRKNDLVFKLIDLENLKTSRVGLVHEDGIMSPAYIRLSMINGGDIHYFYYQFFDLYLRGVFNQLGAGVRSTLGQNDLLDLGVVLPGLEEQTQIVRYLDTQDRRINRLIRDKRRLIELLNEQKQAIIHRAVTCGLDPNVRLKPSGIGWLGDVPEHWEVVPLKRACVLIRDGTHLPPQRVDNGIPLLSVRNIIKGKFVMRDDDSQISETDYRVLCKSFEVRQYDILLAIVGGTLGKVAIVHDMPPFHIQRSLAVLRAKQTVLDYRFLAYFLQGPGFQRALWQTVAFSAQPGIYLGTIINFPVVLPPLDEQKILVSILDYAIKDVECSIKATYKEIDLLREYRTRLISDVVTGKLDVRGVEMPAMDEAEVLEDIKIGEDIESEELIESEGIDDDN